MEFVVTVQSGMFDSTVIQKEDIVDSWTIELFLNIMALYLSELRQIVNPFFLWVHFAIY